MATYRIHFTWKDKARVINCRDLDMTHPYFVSLEKLVFPEPSKVIIGPDDDELRREFGEARSIMIPFQNVQLIEMLNEEVDDDTAKVIRFEKREPEEDD